MKKLIIFYSHNFGWLGHNKRLSLIIREFLLNFWNEYNCLLLNSWEEQNFLFNNIKWLKVINLPLYKFENYKLAWNYNRIEIARKVIFQKIFSSNLKIESLIIEHYPFWRNFLDNEIKFLISEFRKKHKFAKVLSSVRDVVDLKSINNNNLNLFDRFLIHSDEKVINYNDYFSEYINNKIIYTWYVVDNLNYGIVKKENFIYINVWWWQDWFDYIVDFLQKFNKIKNKFDYQLIVSLWNLYENKNIDTIKNIYIWNLKICKYIENSLELKLKSLFCVSMGGYNNMIENLKYNIKSIIYPRLSDDEQQQRLKFFQKISKCFYNWFELEWDDFFSLLKLDDINIEHSTENINLNWAYFSAWFLVNFHKYKFMKIRLTNFCNAKCDMCWVIKRKLEYNKIKNLEKLIVDFYKLWWEVVNFTWWEPTIYKWFWNLLKLSKKLNLITSVSTNGSTLGNVFLKNIYFENARLIDYIDISVDWLQEDHDIRRKYKWLFKIISGNLKKIVDSWIYVHINITIRKDNIIEMRNIFRYFQSFWIRSISFWMIASDPLNDTSNIIPEVKDLRNFYLIDRDYIIKNAWNMSVKFSPDFIWINDINEFIKSIKLKNAFPKKSWEKCYYINKKQEIRINENWNISPCCIIDDFDEWLWNINKNYLLEIICSKEYENFLNRKFPDISKACLNCKIWE